MPLNIDWQQILLHLLNFVILFTGLWFLLYKPVRAFMQKRREHYEKMDAEAAKQVRINEAEAEVVREIFRKYSQGFKENSIADDLKERNVRRKNGKYIDQKYVYVILHDKRYTGVVTHKGEEYYNIFPPIITKEVWSQVNAINEENKQAPSRKKEIFDSSSFPISSYICGCSSPNRAQLNRYAVLTIASFQATCPIS